MCICLIYILGAICYTKKNGNEVTVMPTTLSSYTEQYLVSSTDTDAVYECRPSALFVFLQKAITEHSQQVGTSRDDVLAKYNCYWMAVSYTHLAPPLHKTTGSAPASSPGWQGIRR